MNLITIGGLRDDADPFFNTYRWARNSVGGRTMVLIDEVEDWLKANTPSHEVHLGHYSIYITFPTEEEMVLFKIFWGG